MDSCCLEKSRTDEPNLEHMSYSRVKQNNVSKLSYCMEFIYHLIA